jgi:hypothetical protein
MREPVVGLSARRQSFSNPFSSVSLVALSTGAQNLNVRIVIFPKLSTCRTGYECVLSIDATEARHFRKN